MNRSILVRQADGSEHQFEQHDLPLRLGSGPDSHIILPGADPEVAYIGDARGHLFIQPADDSEYPLLHNDRLLSASAWLKSNDQVSGKSFVVEYRRSGDRISFDVISAERTVSPTPLSPPPQPPNQPLSADNGAAIPVTVKRPGKTGSGKKFAFGLIALGGVLLTCALLFVLLARPLELQIEPEPEQISISGSFPVVKIGSRYLGLPGSYTAVISKPGYKDLRQDVVISRGTDNRVSATLEKLPGILRLEVTPPDGVAVFSGNELLGTTPPGRLEIPPGSHLLSLQKKRYQPFQKEVVIEGAGVEQEFRALLIPDWAKIAISSEPAGASVIVDGTVAGQTPLVVELLSGTRQLMLSKELFIDQEQTFEVEAGVEKELHYLMAPLPGRLLLTSRPDGAVVTLDGGYRGITPLTLDLEPGVEKSIRLSLNGHKSLNRLVELLPGEEKKLELRLEQESGIVYLTTTPAGAEVSINGKKYAGIQGELTLPASPQTFEVSMAGYKSVRRTITPHPGFSQQLAIELVPESGVSLEPPPQTPLSDELTTAAGHLLVLVEPRPFTMGAPRREPGRRANERERQVVMTKPFLIGAKTVTNGDFRRFKSTHESGGVGGYSLDGEDQPVVNITWNEAAEYLNWLSSQDNLTPFYTKDGTSYKPVSPLSNGYRLPTETEWAYSARHAANRQGQRYPWPGGFPPRSVVANLADESARTILPRVISGYDDGFGVTAPVGSFPADKAGLYDIAGNVAEWCHDYYSAYTAGLSATPDPLGPPAGTHRVIRGSSWRDGSVAETRLSYRAYHKEARDNVGFRVARYP